jgi:hypothetical protein
VSPSNVLVRGTAALLVALACAGATRAQVDEPQLRAALERALWPNDIVRAADRYLQAYPGSPDVEAIRGQAAQTARVVARHDLRLYRSAFAAPSGDDQAAHDLRRAALGDREAAVRLAHAQRGIDGGRYVGWLQYASMLGDERASYELALHFRRDDQPVLAAQYETLALALGYRPAPSLDNTRK